MKKIIILLLSFVALVSCNTFSDVGKVLRNEKTNTTDEFLVKKKQPLVLPPDFSLLPEPETKDQTINTENEFNLKKILEGNSNNDKNFKVKSSNSVEKSILDKINKK